MSLFRSCQSQILFWKVFFFFFCSLLVRSNAADQPFRPSLIKWANAIGDCRWSIGHPPKANNYVLIGDNFCAKFFFFRSSPSSSSASFFSLFSIKTTHNDYIIRPFVTFCWRNQSRSVVTQLIMAIGWEFGHSISARVVTCVSLNRVAAQSIDYNYYTMCVCLCTMHTEHTHLIGESLWRAYSFVWRI